MQRFPLRLAALSLSLCLPALAACGGKALGTEPAGQRIRAASGFNLRVIPEQERSRRPRFSGALMDGTKFSSTQLSGQIAVVNFWASWCGPCRKEQRQLEALSDRYGPQGIRFIGVNTRDTKADARSYMEEFGVTYPSIFDRFATIAFKFRVQFIPSTFVLDRNGAIAAVITGATVDERQLSDVLDRELAR